jgi:hypothetical protein
MDKINGKYGEELKKMCKEYGDTDVDEVFIFGLDRLGFDLMGRYVLISSLFHEHSHESSIN